MALKMANALLTLDAVTDKVTTEGILDHNLPEFSVDVAEGQTNLWSGAEGRAAAEAGGGTTVGRTAGGRAVAQRTAGMVWDAARKVWVRVSKAYAEQAKGVVNCYLENGLKPGTIFSQTELGTLLRNPKVTKVNVFVRENGKWVQKNWFKARL
jgi:hypothetical protein